MEGDRRNAPLSAGERLAVALFASAVCALAVAQAQTFRLSGRVTDKETGEALSSATVRIAGTTRGTITNVDGRYILRTSAGQVLLVYSYIGYRTDSVSVAVSGDAAVEVSLVPAAIELPEVVVAAEDPAMGIMRRVIENKSRWRDSLQAYRFSAFTRQVFRRDTAIASISESYTVGYWRRGDTLRERVSQKRQTENIPIGANFAFVGKITSMTTNSTSSGSGSSAQRLPRPSTTTASSSKGSGTAKTSPSTTSAWSPDRGSHRCFQASFRSSGTPTRSSASTSRRTKPS